VARRQLKRRYMEKTKQKPISTEILKKGNGSE
jgi:hypothetical protein